MRVAEGIMSIPSFYLLINLASILPSNMTSNQRFALITSILALIGWAGFSRVIRGMVLSIKNQEYVKAACQAISLALKIYSEFESNKAEIIKFERTNELSRQRGILSEGLKSYVERYLNLPLTSYLEAIISQIMQEHTIVAIAKMGNSSSDLRKFIFEGGRAILVEQRYPVETSPRIDSLRNFLQDMGYITEDNKLTNIATKFIADYGKE